jgi:DNA-binding Lrp family transcriptional regulator
VQHGRDTNPPAETPGIAGGGLFARPGGAELLHPDEANMHLLEAVTEERQKEEWLRPLAAGEIHVERVLDTPGPAMRPSPNGLRTFEAAARLMSFTRAADELNVTQTAVSRQIRRLEEQLQKRLFVRKNRALALTRDAADYLPAIRAAFDDLRRATERLQRPERKALLTVSTTTSLAAKWLVTRVASFQDAHPGIEVRLTTSPHLVDFQREEVDMAVRYGRGNWPGLTAQRLMAEDIFPVCSRP